MESLPNENGGCKVYRRKRKIPSSSEGSNPEEAIPMNSKNTKGKAKSHIPPCVVVQGNECNELVELDKGTGKEASNSDAHVGSSMAPQAQNEVNHDKLLILRDVLEKSIHEDLPESTLPCDKDDIEESGRIQRVYTAYGQEHKEKYEKLRARQKQRLALRNKKSKRTLPSLRILGPRQDSNHHIVKEGNNGAAADESLRILKGKNVAIPNSSSHKMNGSSSPGKTMVQSASTRRPSGYLKIKTKDNANGVEWNGMELDALWIGVRRYGQAKWEQILGDPYLRKYFNKKKTPYDLYTKWKAHHQKISSSSPKPPKNGVTHPSAVPLSPPLMAAARRNPNNAAISIRNRTGANSPHSSSSSSAAAGPALNNNNMNMMNPNGDEDNPARLMRLQLNMMRNALRNLRTGPVQNAARGVTRERNNMPLNIDLNFPPPDEEEEQDTDSETTLSC